MRSHNNQVSILAFRHLQNLFRWRTKFYEQFDLHGWFHIDRNKLLKPFHRPLPLSFGVSQQNIAMSLDGMQQRHVDVFRVRQQESKGEGSMLSQTSSLLNTEFFASSVQIVVSRGRVARS